MNLVAKARNFLYQSRKNAELKNQALWDFSFDMMTFDQTQYPGVSVDIEQVKAAGKALYSSLVQKNPQGAVSSLKTLLDLLQSGGGDLYNQAKVFLQEAKTMLPKPKPVQYLSPNYYKALNDLNQLAQSGKGLQSPEVIQEIKQKYENLRKDIDSIFEGLEFQEALAETGKSSNDQTEKSKSEAKAKEIRDFKSKMFAATNAVEAVLYDKGVMPKDIKNVAV